jgi:hypothetical protein
MSSTSKKRVADYEGVPDVIKSDLTAWCGDFHENLIVTQLGHSVQCKCNSCAVGPQTACFYVAC